MVKRIEDCDAFKLPSYAWQNKDTKESSQRLGNLQEIYDPISISYFEKFEATAGWSCLEVGGGGGSLVRWLAKKVGPTGHVLVTDIDPRFLEELKNEFPNIQVLRHDIARDELPVETFDLAHARLVLVHVPEREAAIAKMISSLKRGGWLLIEDFDIALIDAFGADFHPRLGDPPEMSTDLYRRHMEARNKVLAAHGADMKYARRLYALLKSAGLENVGLDGRMTYWPGGSSGAKIEQANSIQSRAEILATGLVSEKEFDEVIVATNDPQWARVSPLMVSAWGRKP
jgi:SAM-dependent methyltransferase